MPNSTIAPATKSFARSLPLALLLIAAVVSPDLRKARGQLSDAADVLHDAPFDNGTADRNQLSIPRRFKLLLMDQYDIEDVKGWITFTSNPLQKLEQPSAGSGMEVLTNVPQADGTWLAYGMAFQGGESPRRPRTGKEYFLVRARTKDGLNFYEREEKAWEGAGPGSGMFTQKSLAYNAVKKQFLLLFFEWWGYLSQAKGYPAHAYVSGDGMTFAPTKDQPAYCGNDGLHVMWDPKSQDYFSYQCLFQPWAKPIPDNAEHGRRVIGVLRSSDGERWQPRGGLVEDQWKGHTLLTPNERDPDGVEFYWMTPFPYADRYMAMLMIYQPSPAEVNSRAPGVVGAHGPQLATEWVVSRDGLEWNRPYQHDYLGLEPNATGAFASGRPDIVQCDPVIANNRVVFPTGFGLQEDRFGAVVAAGNAEFSTHLFEMPKAPLFMNATAKFIGTEAQDQNEQGFIMVEARDDKGNVIAGYERENCYFRNADDLSLPLQWKGRDLQELAGQKIKLHFYFRNARIYAVSTKAGVIPPGKPTPVVLPKQPEVRLTTRFTTTDRLLPATDFDSLAKQLKSTDVDMRRQAIWDLAKLEDTRAVAQLLRATHDPNYLVRYSAAQALWFSKKEAILPRLFADHDSDANSLASLINAIRDIWREEVILVLRDMATKSKRRESRVSAIRLTADSNYRMFIPDMIQLMKDRDPEIQQAAIYALAKLTGKDGLSDREAWQQWWQDETSDESDAYDVYSTVIDKYLAAGASTIVINQQTLENPMAPEDWAALLDYIRKKMPSADPSAVDNLVKKGWRTARLDEKRFKTQPAVKVLDHGTLVEILSNNGSSAVLRERYPKSNGLMRLSRVGFNDDRSKAFLFAGNMRNNMFGSASFFVLERDGDGWNVKQTLPITALSTDPDYKMPSRYSNAF